MMKKIIISLGILTVLFLMVALTVKAITLTGIEIVPTTVTIIVGRTQTLRAVPRPDGATLPAVTWVSLDPAVGTIAPTPGVVGTATFTSLSAGSARITATGGGVVGRATVIVTPAPVDPAAVIGDVISLVRTLLILIAVLFILFGAFTFITAGGDDKKIETGRKAILWAIIAVVVAAIAHGIVMWVEGWAA